MTDAVRSGPVFGLSKGAKTGAGVRAGGSAVAFREALNAAKTPKQAQAAQDTSGKASEGPANRTTAFESNPGRNVADTLQRYFASPSSFTGTNDTHFGGGNIALKIPQLIDCRIEVQPDTPTTEARIVDCELGDEPKVKDPALVDCDLVVETKKPDAALVDCELGGEPKVEDPALVDCELGTEPTGTDPVIVDCDLTDVMAGAGNVDRTSQAAAPETEPGKIDIETASEARPAQTAAENVVADRNVSMPMAEPRAVPTNRNEDVAAAPVAKSSVNPESDGDDADPARAAETPKADNAAVARHGATLVSGIMPSMVRNQSVDHVPGAAQAAIKPVRSVDAARPAPETGLRSGEPQVDVQPDAEPRTSVNARDTGQRETKSLPDFETAGGSATEQGPSKVTILSSQVTPAAVSAAVLTPTASGIVDALSNDPGVRAYASTALQAGDHVNQPKPGPIHTLRIQLNPAELGSVIANLRAVGDQLEIEIKVDSGDAHRQLSSDAESIAKAMRSIGYDVERVTITQNPAGANAQGGNGSERGGSFSASGDGERGSRGASGRDGQGDDGRNGGRNDGQARADPARSGVYI